MAVMQCVSAWHKVINYRKELSVNFRCAKLNSYNFLCIGKGKYCISAELTISGISQRICFAFI